MLVKNEAGFTNSEKKKTTLKLMAQKYFPEWWWIISQMPLIPLECKVLSWFNWLENTDESGNTQCG